MEVEWEESKENYQPLKQGRDPLQLAAAPTVGSKTKKGEDERKAFEESIANYQGNDPLELWLRYLKWTQETFRAGGHQAELLPLLEKCTRSLQATGNFNQDVRYLRVWIQYADLLPEPQDVFSFLKENDIGQEHALYYEAYATFLELRGSYSRARAVYEDGINRRAKPVERLRNKCNDFEHRMARRIQRQSQEDVGTTPIADGEAPRDVLGALAARRSHGSRRPASQGHAGGGLQGVQRDRQPAAAAAPSRTGNHFQAPLEVFVDEEFQPGGAPAAPSFRGPGGASSRWTSLGGFEQTRKENVQQAAKWNSARLPQKKSACAPPAPMLDIPIDEELQNRATPGTLRQRLDATGLEEVLVQDPLRLHMAPPMPGSMASATVRLHSSSAAEPPLKRKKEEVMAYDAPALTSASGEELSFEELRAAAHWHARHPATPAPAMPAQSHAVHHSALSSPAKQQQQQQHLWPQHMSYAVPLAQQSAEAHAIPQPVQVGSLPLQAGSACSPATQLDPIVEVTEEHTGQHAACTSPVSIQAMEAPATCPATPTPALPAQAAPHMPPNPSASQQLGSLITSEQLSASQGSARSREQQSDAQAEKMYSDLAPAGPAESWASGPSVSTAAAEPDSTAQQDAPAANVLPMLQQVSINDENAQVQAARRPASGGGGKRLAVLRPPPLQQALTLATPVLQEGSAEAHEQHNLVPAGAVSPELALLDADSRTAPQVEASAQDLCADTVTLNTQAAFDSLNDFWDGGLPHERRPAVEPTITLSTRAAFEELNAMFSEHLPHEAAARTASRPAIPLPPRNRQSRARSRLSVQPLPRDENLTLPIYEDTEFLPPLPAQEYATGALPMYEDTQFLTHRLPAGEPTSSLGVYEDTQFLDQPPRPAADAPGQLGLYEDTQFLTQRVGPSHQATGALQLYEDTQFLGQAAGGAAEQEQAADVPQVLGGSMHSLPSAAGSQELSSGNEVSRGYPEDVENWGQERPLLPRRSAPGPTALQMIGMDRAAALGIEIGTGLASDDEGEPEEGNDVQPELRLSMAGVAIQDDFEVYRDA